MPGGGRSARPPPDPYLDVSSCSAWLSAQVCFVFQELDMCLEAQWDLYTALRIVASHVMMLLIVGKGLPILVAVFIEGRARLQFLRAR